MSCKRFRDLNESDSVLLVVYGNRDAFHQEGLKIPVGGDACGGDWEFGRFVKTRENIKTGELIYTAPVASKVPENAFDVVRSGLADNARAVEQLQTIDAVKFSEAALQAAQQKWDSLVNSKGGADKNG